MDQSTGGEVEGLLDVFEGAHDAAYDVQSLQGHHERRGAGDDAGVLGEADGDHAATGPEHHGRGGVAFLGGGGDDDAVGPVGGDLGHLGRDVLAGLEVDVGFGPELLAEFALFRSSVHGDDSHALKREKKKGVGC